MKLTHEKCPSTKNLVRVRKHSYEGMILVSWGTESPDFNTPIGMETLNVFEQLRPHTKVFTS